MRETVFRTINVPASGVTSIPALVQAGASPLRVLIRNIGGVPIVIALSATAFTETIPSPDCYQIPPGQSDSIVLSPSQLLVVAAVGAGGSICYAASEAIPYDLRS